MSPRGIRWPLGLAAIFGLVGCDRTPPVPRTNEAHELPPLPASSPHLALTCDVEQTSERLRIRYAATNRSAEDCFLLNKATHEWGPEQQGIQPWGGVYDAGSGVANVVLGVSALPPREVHVAHVPGATLLAAGQLQRGTIDLPLPLREWNVYYRPYDQDLARDARSVPEETTSIRSIRVFVDFIRRSATFQVKTLGDGTLLPDGQPESAWCTATLPTAAELRRRNDGPWAGHGSDSPRRKN